MRSRVVLVLLLGILFVGNGLSQTTGATIQGTVTDSSGAVIPGATVKVEIVDRKTAREATTDDAGFYQIPFLLNGTYTVTATANGLQTMIERDIALETRQVRRVDFRMQLGKVSEQVTVTDYAPVINTDTPSIAKTYSGVQIDMPSSQKKFINLVAHQLVEETPAAGQGIFTFYGARYGYAKATVDGFQAPNVFWTTLPIEGIQEVKAMVLDAPAEFATAVSVDVVTRGGSNDLHGSAGIEVRNAALNSVGPFATSRPVGTPSHLWSTGVGGPVYIPKIYNGKNKTFWFFALNRRDSGPQGYARSLAFPTTAFRSGDLSAILPGTQLKNPFTGAIVPNNNLAAVASINTVAQNVLSVYPKAQNENLGANTFPITYQTDVRTMYSARIDQRITSRNTFTWSYSRQPIDSAFDGTLTGSGGSGGIPDLPRYFQQFLGWNTVFADTHVFSSSIVNEFRFAYGYQTYSFAQNTIGQDYVKKFGLQGIPTPPTPDLTGLPRIVITGFEPVKAIGQSTQTPKNLQWVDTVSIHKGSHTIKAGLDIHRFQEDDIGVTQNVFGTFNFDGRFTGTPFGDFWFGLPGSSTLYYSRPITKSRMTEFGGFVQDEYRVTPRLNINYGVRYELFTVPIDAAGLYYGFDTKSGSIVVPDDKALAGVNKNFSSAVPIVKASTVGLPTNLMNGNHKNFFPRIGFAYRLTNDNKAVVRGGYGIYIVPLSFGALNTGGPFAVSVTYDNSITNGTPRFQWPNAAPIGTGTTATPSANFIDPNFRMPYVQQWNLTLERQVAGLGLRASYVGTKGTDLGYTVDLNRPVPSTTPFTDPVTGLPRYTYSNFSSVTETVNGGNDMYHGLDLSIEHPFKDGLMIKAGYTFAKHLADIGAGTFDTFSSGGPENPYDRARDRGNSSMTTKNAFLGSMVYEAPVGKGRRFLHDLPGPSGKVLNAVIGNWSMSSLVTIRSGVYFTPTYTGSDPSNTNNFSGRPDLVAGCDPNNALKNKKQWFNPGCFTAPPANSGRFGNAGRNILVGPGLWKVDMSFFKDFLFRDRYGLRFSMLANNIFNHPNDGLPSAVVNVAGAGTITGPSDARGSDAYAYYRQIAFDLRLRF